MTATDTASGLSLTRAGKPNRRELAKARTRERLLDAARFMFSNVGYEASTIRDLAQRIGMSTGAIFGQFRDKADLWRAAMGTPPPSIALAEEIGVLLAQRPDWRWLLRYDGTRHIASINDPDYVPMSNKGRCHIAHAASPAEAMRQARIEAERHDGPAT